MAAALTYLAMMAVLIIVVSLVLRWWPSIGGAVLAGEANRKHALDGTRGILALSVMMHHLLLHHTVALPIRDLAPLKAHPFIAQLGSAPVAMFFMISAYLFGGRLLRNDGALNPWSFFTGRVMRIVPLYLFAVGASVVFAFAVQGFRLVVPPGQLLMEIGRNLAFNFVRLGPVNGSAEAREMLVPVWTLQYEWTLYFTIPVMAFAYRRLRWPLLLYVLLFVLVRALHDGRYYFFMAGIAGAQLAALPHQRLKDVWAITGPLGLIALPALYFNCVSWPQALLLLPAFVAILQSHRWVALLGVRPLRFLGEISFSIYLLHGLVLVAATRFLHIPWREFGELPFMAAGLAIGVAAVALSTVTFLLIEKPLMHLRWAGPGRVARPLPTASATR